MGQRVVTADTVKGIAIILMVFGHTEQGGMHRHLWDGLSGVVPGLKFGDAFIYSFHMAAFFFIAGLFLEPSLSRRGACSFVLTKIHTILYPYILWALITALLDPLTARFRSSSAAFSWHSFYFGFLSGNASWFLITLFVCQMLALVVVRLPNWLQFILALGACFLATPSSVTLLYKPLLFFPFVTAGMWFSEQRILALEHCRKAFAWGGFCILLVAQVTLSLALSQDKPWNKLLMGLLGTAMLFFLSQGLRKGVLDRVLVWYGEASLGIFVLSPFFQGVGREFVTRVMHTVHPLPYLAVTTLIATTIPSLLWHSRDSLRIGWLFAWPAREKTLREKEQPVAG